MAFLSSLQKGVKSSTISALGSASGGTTYGATTISLASADFEQGSLVANVTTNITTTSLQMLTKWQVSQDGSTWVDLYAENGVANVRVAAAGTGSLVSTSYAQALPFNISHPYVRLAVVASAATGTANDTAVVSYNFRRRQG